MGELDPTWEIDKSSLWFYASVSYLGSCACIPRRDVVAKNCILRAQPASWVVDLGTFTKSLLWLPYQITTNLGASNNDLISYSSAGQKSGIRFTAPNLRRSCSCGGSREKSVSSPFPVSKAPFFACFDSWHLFPSSTPAMQLPDSAVTSPYSSVLNVPLPPSYKDTCNNIYVLPR